MLIDICKYYIVPVNYHRAIFKLAKGMNQITKRRSVKVIGLPRPFFMAKNIGGGTFSVYSMNLGLKPKRKTERR